MRRVPVGVGHGRDDPVGADPGAGAERPAGDVVEVGRLPERGKLVQVAGVGPEIGMIHQPLAGETTERHRDQVETHELHVEKEVGVGDGVTGQESPIGEPLVEAVERCEHAITDRVVVGLGGDGHRRVGRRSRAVGRSRC